MKSETTYQAVLGRLIAQKRQQKQLDQGDMAEAVGVSRSTWSRIETGESALNMDQLAKAAAKLGMPLGALMVEADEVTGKLRERGVEVLDGRDQTSAAKFGKAAAATVAFLGGAVLGGIVAAIMANKDSEDT